MADPVIDLGSLFGGGLTTGGIVYLFLRAKLSSLSTLWQRFDEFKEEAAALRISDRDDTAAQRLADAKEYATKAELTHAFEKLEAQVDKRFDSLEDQIRDLGRN